jgi:hypothetical protein
MINRKTVVALFVLVASFSQSIGTAECEARIGVFTNFGAPLYGADAKVIDERGVVRYGTSEGKTVLFRVSPGVYDLHVVVAGFEPYDTRIFVRGEKCWFTAGLQLGGLSGKVPRPDVEGRLPRRSRSSEETWVKLTGLYSDFSITARAEGTGRFIFGEVPAGRYILVAWRGDKVLESRVIELAVDSKYITLE